MRGRSAAAPAGFLGAKGRNAFSRVSGGQRSEASASRGLGPSAGARGEAWPLPASAAAGRPPRPSAPCRTTLSLPLLSHGLLAISACVQVSEGPQSLVQ